MDNGNKSYERMKMTQQTDYNTKFSAALCENKLKPCNKTMYTNSCEYPKMNNMCQRRVDI